MRGSTGRGRTPLRISVSAIPGAVVTEVWPIRHLADRWLAAAWEVDVVAASAGVAAASEPAATAVMPTMTL
ncbi:hypothetical protein GCM10027572_19610 [Flexivirga lutea]